MFGRLTKSSEKEYFSAFSPQSYYLTERNLYMTLIFGGWSVYTLKTWELERRIFAKYVETPLFRLEVNTES